METSAPAFSPAWGPVDRPTPSAANVSHLLAAGAITPKHVLALLRHLSRCRAPDDSPLADLAVVRHRLAAAGLEPSPGACAHEVGRLVSEIVEEELLRLRGQVGIHWLSPTEGELERRVRADFAHAQRELEAWSALYYLYVRPDFDLTLQDLVRLVGDRNRRTVQRRMERGVLALVARLQARERDAWMAERRDLQAQSKAAPPMPVGRLVGAEAVIAQVMRWLAEAETSPVLALRGLGGIGKTAVALRVARRAMTEAGFADVLWLACANPAVMAALKAGGLAEAVGRAIHWEPRSGAGLEAASWPGEAAILRHLSRQRCLVVVDGLDNLDLAMQVTDAALRVAGHGRILLTGRVGWSARGDVEVVDAPALDLAAALDLLRQAARHRGLVDVAEAGIHDLAPVVEATAGHPLAIQLAAGQLRVADAETVARDFLEPTTQTQSFYRGLWERAWRSAGSEVHQAVQAVSDASAAVARRPVQHETMDDLGGAAPLAQALDMGFLEPAGHVRRRGYRLSLFLERYLRLEAQGT